MMEQNHPSLLQLLVPNSDTAPRLQAGKMGQVRSAFAVGSAAAPVERAVTAVTGTRAASNDYMKSSRTFSPSKGATTTKTTGWSSDVIATFTDNGSTLLAQPNERQSSAVGDIGVEEEGCPAVTTVSSRTAFSSVSRKNSITYPSIITAVGLEVQDRAAGQTASLASVSGAVVGAAASAAAAAAAATADPLDPRLRKTSSFTSSFSSSSTTALTHHRRRSTRVNIFLPAETEFDWELERFAQPRAPPRHRRATLAGQPELSDDAEADSQTEGEHNCYTMPTDRYISNLFTSYDLDLASADAHMPARVLNMNGSVFSSSLASSGCPSSTSQRKRTSLKIHSTTMAPVASNCSSLLSATAPQDGKARRSSQGFPTRTAATGDDVRRPSRVAFLPEEWLVGPLTHSEDATAPTCKAHKAEVATPATTGIADEGDRTFADTAVIPAAENKNIMDVYPGIGLPRTHTNILLRDTATNTSATGSALSGVSLDARNSTQRQHASLTITRSLDVLQDDSAVAVDAAGDAASLSLDAAQNYLGGDDDSGGEEEHSHRHEGTPSKSPATAKTAKCSGVLASVDTFTTLLAAVHAEPLCPHGAASEAASNFLHFSDGGDLDLSASSFVSDVATRCDGAARQRGRCSRSHSSWEHDASTLGWSSAAVWWTYSTAHVMFSRDVSPSTMVWRYIHKGKLLLFGLLRLVKRALLSPFTMLTSTRTGGGGDRDRDARNSAFHHNSSKMGAQKKKKPHHLCLKLKSEVNGGLFSQLYCGGTQ
jgi:hypothetical protein